MRALVLIFAFVLVLFEVTPAVAAPDRPGDAVRRALAAQGPMIEPREYALIRAKCGLPAGTAPVHNLNMTNGAIDCPTGRTVRDAETIALGDRIGKRADAYAHAALNRPEVKQAIDRYADEQTAAALARLRRQGVIRN